MLRMFPMVPTTTVMMVSTPDTKYWNCSITSECSSFTPHLAAIVTEKLLSQICQIKYHYNMRAENDKITNVIDSFRLLTVDDIVSILVKELQGVFIVGEVDKLKIRDIKQVLH